MEVLTLLLVVLIVAVVAMVAFVTVQRKRRVGGVIASRPRRGRRRS